MTKKIVKRDTKKKSKLVVKQLLIVCTAKQSIIWLCKKSTWKDLTALLKEHHTKGDSPIKKKIEDARLQWEKRSYCSDMMNNPALVPTNTDQLNQSLEGLHENSTAWL